MYFYYLWDVYVVSTIAQYQAKREKKSKLKVSGQAVAWELREQRIDLTKWVGEAWEDLITNHFNIIDNSWKSSGLLNRIDGSED